MKGKNKPGNRRHVYYALLVLSVSALFLIYLWPSASSGNNNPGPSNRNITIRVADTSTSYSPLYIADRMGFFRDEGLDVRIVKIPSIPKQIEAAYAGEIDAGTGGYMYLIPARLAGIKVTAVADSLTSFKENPVIGWYVLENSSIRSAKDLKGKKLGILFLGSGSWYITRVYLAQANLTKDDITTVVLPYQNLEPALRTGQVDIIIATNPLSSRIESVGGVRRLFTDADVLGEYSVGAEYFTDRFLSKNPEAARGFIRAWNRAAEYSQSHPEESKKIVAEVLGFDVKDVIINRMTKNVALDLNSVKTWIDIMVKYGDLKEGQVRPEDIATNAYNTLVAK